MSSICDPFSNMLRFRLVDFEKIPPDTIGVYGIWYFKRCIYIGKAEKQPISNRLQQHWSMSHNKYLQFWIDARGRDLKVSYKPISSKQRIDVYERYFINRFQPVTNIIRYE